MLITELAKLTESPEPMLFGVQVDGECFTPPAGLRHCAFLWKGGAPNSIDEQLVDAIVGFSLSQVEVTLEIDCDDEVDSDYIMTLAGNAGFSVSIIPPENPELDGKWHRQIDAFARSFLSTPNFSGSLYPVSGYFGYLVAERHARVSSVTPTDPYVVQRFFSAISEERSDAAKEVIKSAFFDMAGGREEFEKLLDALMAGIYARTEDIIRGNSTPAPNA